MSAISELRAAAAFLSPLGQPAGPASSAVTPTPRTMAYFPLVGAAIGALVGLAWKQAEHSSSRFLAAALAQAADCGLTGALHLDGVADTADGLLAHVPAKDRLDIMAEPGVGAFAVTAVGVALMTRVAALAALEPSPALLAALYCSSRSVMVIGARSVPYARKEGIVTAFLPSGSFPPQTRPGPVDQALLAAVGGAVAALGLASAVAGRRGAVSVVAGWGAAGLVLESARRRLGGYTGDVLGAAGVACETLGLVVAAQGTRSPHG
ncbi:MAG TPA: adenosylcobinamide-GDP ribazoletransferase [Acidimicrobiales bacterium]|nr:adenosylcobinamide-GDP ribazoletransferase [Acidimicrobiales bacterium]